MPTLEEMRAEINRLLPDVETPNFLKTAKTPFHMPGVAEAAATFGSSLAAFVPAHLYGVAKGIQSGEFGQSTKVAQEEAAKKLQNWTYKPRTEAGQSMVESIEAIPRTLTGSHMGAGPMAEIWKAPIRISPSDVQVMGARGINAAREIGDIPRDFSAAQSGLTRLNAYNEPTYGARMQGVAEDIGDVMARRQAMRSEEGAPVLSGFGTFTDLVPDPRMYAIKPKGGNWPTTLGSTIPLKEQGVFGKHLSESQLKEGGDNVLDLFERQLKNFYPRAVDNRQLLHDWEDFYTKYDSDVDYDITGDLANQFVQKINAKNLSLDPNAKQLKSISDLEKIIPTYNSWIMGNYQKYMRDFMGTGIEFDPMLQEIEKANIPLKDLFEEKYSLDDNVWKDIATRRRSERRQNSPRDLNIDLQDPLNKNIGIQTAQTEPGKMFEDYIDAALGLKGEYTYPRYQYPAMTAILDRNENAKINDLILDNLSSESGMPFIREKFLKDLMSGDLPLEKVAQTTPATILRDVIKSHQAQQKSKEAVQKAKDTWRASRFNEIQSDIEYPDGSKMHVITPEDAKTNPNLVLRDLGQSTIDLKQCIGAGCRNTPDYPDAFGPYIEPHTGKEARQASPYEETHAKRYMDKLKQGKTEIARLLDPKGVAKASVLMEVRGALLGSVAAHERFIKDWVNSEYSIVNINNKELLQNADFGASDDRKKLFEAFPGLEKAFTDHFKPDPQKSILEMKGFNNEKVAPEYVPHMVSWLNQYANELTDVRDLQNLPSVQDLNSSYDSIGKMMDEYQHWYSPTVEKFFDEMENEKALPRFFTTDEFALKATERGVDLSAEPKNDVVNNGVLTDQEIAKRQKYYETVSRELRNTFIDEYLQDAFNGDQDALRAILREIDERPTGYFLGSPSPGIRQHVINRLRNEGLHNPNELVDAIAGMQPEAEQQLRPVAAPRQAVRELDVNDRDLLQLGMDDYFNNPDNPNFVVERGLLDEIRILAGDQDLVAHPERRLPRELHERVVNMLLNQNNYVEDITNLANNLERGNHLLMETQAENLLNIITSWTERFPLNERQEDALVNVIRDMEPEPQQLPFNRPEFPGPLGQNMRDYFEGNEYNAPEDMIEPYATDTRILMGSQRPEAILPERDHREIVRALLDQDNRTDDIRILLNHLQTHGELNLGLTTAQAENLLNILISWTERYPLNE